MTYEKVSTLAELPVGSMHLAKAAGRRLCLVRTSEGIFALDNACPHEGYGLVQGNLDGDELTCEWHNWRFRVTDGSCVLGEEGVRAHAVRIDGDDVLVEVVEPSPGELRPVLMASLRRGMAEDYVGQVSRDVVRLLRAEADPVQLVWEAVAYGAPRGEFGFGHALASATDCLAIADRYDGDARALPVVQAIAGITEVERRRPLRPHPEPLATLPPDPRVAFRHLVEEGWTRLDDAEALLRGAIEAGTEPAELRRWLIGPLADHHLGYGHGAIYTQKAFELLDRLGWDRAATVLPHLVAAHLAMTREDRLPYMRPYVRALEPVDLGALADAEEVDGWVDDGRLAVALRDGRLGDLVGVATEAVQQGAGISGLLDAVALAASERLLRYDHAVDFDRHSDFGWLDITHALTYANAARWAWGAERGPDTARLALWAAFLARYSGRKEYKAVAEPILDADDGWDGDVGDDQDGDVAAAIANGRPDVAARAALAGDRAEVGDALERASLADGAGSFIVAAHLVKTAHSAVAEAETTGSSLPLAGTARFLAAPRMERFVAASVTRSIDFLSGRGPADRAG